MKQSMKVKKEIVKKKQIEKWKIMFQMKRVNEREKKKRFIQTDRKIEKNI